MATQETIARPAPFVEKLGEDLATQVTAQTAVPIVSTGLQGLGTMAQPTQQSFETADDFKRRQDLFKAQQQAALGFEARQQGLAGLRPQVEGLSQLEKDARTRAQAGLGSFQPFLDQAQAASAVNTNSFFDNLAGTSSAFSILPIGTKPPSALKSISLPSKSNKGIVFFATGSTSPPSAINLGAVYE